MCNEHQHMRSLHEIREAAGFTNPPFPNALASLDVAKQARRKILSWLAVRTLSCFYLYPTARVFKINEHYPLFRVPEHEPESQITSNTSSFRIEDGDYVDDVGELSILWYLHSFGFWKYEHCLVSMLNISNHIYCGWYMGNLGTYTPRRREAAKRGVHRSIWT